MDAEVQQLSNELDRIAESTSFNGQTLLNGDLGAISRRYGMVLWLTFASFETYFRNTAGQVYAIALSAVGWILRSLT